MARYSGGLRALVSRAAQAIITLLGASLVIWVLALIGPGNPAARVLMAGGLHNPTTGEIRAEAHRLGLDQPAYLRYWHWLVNAVQGNLGTSWSTGRPVTQEFTSRLGATARLTSAALVLAVAIAIILAIIAFAGARKWPDMAARTIALFLISVPSFLIGIAVLNIVVVRFGHFEVLTNGNWNTVFLPALTLALAPGAAWSRVLRASLLEASGAAYQQVALARGVRPPRLLMQHTMLNSMTPFLTVVGVGTAALLGGAPIVEAVYTWPGVGAFLVQAIGARDIPVVQGFTLIGILIYVVTSFVVDIIIGMIDPRARRASVQQRRGSASRISRHGFHRKVRQEP
jgi:glutathione transport system permease protein